MGKFAAYTISLKDIPEGVKQTYRYTLDDDFFALVDGPEVQRGKVEATVNATCRATAYEVEFIIDGNICIPCDRCLDDMEHHVEAHETLKVEIGDAYSDESDDKLVIPPTGELEIAWLLYEFIALTIPLKHVHPAGQCNEEMSKRLDNMSAHMLDDDDDPHTGSDDDNATDPRWDALKKLKE